VDLRPHHRTGPATRDDDDEPNNAPGQSRKRTTHPTPPPPNPIAPLARRHTHTHPTRCILGVLTYKAVFRTRYSSISPSSYTARGSFARVGIPAPPNFDYATPSQRARIERLGRVFGCHTCGSRMIGSAAVPRFHADHIPPVSVARQLNDRWYRRWLGLRVKQRFYPQCQNCSNRQGGLLSKAVNAGHRNLCAAGGGAEGHFHGRRLRIGHLTGGAVAVLSVGGRGDGDAADLVRSSRERVRSIQDALLMFLAKFFI
jgi:hypothetical protein